MRLPEFSVKQPVATLMLLLALALLGFVSIFKLNIDMLPDIEPPVVSILTTWPGASASDVETEVTKKIEDEVNSVNNLDTLTSKSLDNLSVVVCKFDWGASLDAATNDVRDKLEQAKRNLPKDVEQPMLYKFSSATAPILFGTITGDASWPRLYRLADKKIADELRRIPGVGLVNLYGGMQRRINVYFDLKKIEGYRLSLPMINQALAAENLNLPAGNIKTGLNDYFVRVPGRYMTVEEIGNTIIGSFNGKSIYLRDVADVKDDYKTQDINGWGDGKKGIVMILQRQTGENTVEVINRVRERLTELQSTLPSDIKINFVMDSSENILNSIKNLSDTLGWGIFFVVLVTFAMLRRFRPALIIALSIPFSLMISFTFMYFFGYTINMVSLMSLAISTGMVVDNGVVVLENIVRHLEQGARPGPAAMFGASEMGLAITASSLTTVVVFVPMMFLTGLAGIIFKQLAFVLSITILASLFTALTLTPMLASKWISGHGDDDEKGFLAGFRRVSENGFVALERGYEGILAWALSHRKMVFGLAIAVFAGSLSLIPFLSSALFPVVDTGDMAVAFRMPEGTRIEETSRVVQQILDAIDTVVKPEEFRASYAFNGQTPEGKGVALGFDEGPNVGQIGFKLVDCDKRDRSAKEVANALRDNIEKIPGISQLKVMSQDPIVGILMGNAKPLIVELQGSDLDQLLDFANQLKSTMESIRGLVDVSISQKDPRPELWVMIDRAKASELGLSVASISMVLRNYFYGNEATQFRDAGDNFDIFTRLSKTDKGFGKF
ncbi:MAG: efflux RND transporter permease subunit [Desulfosalsimonadaceae bacterium]